MKPLLDHQKATSAAARVIYPDSDGKPIGETGIHVRASFHLYSALRWLFRRRLHTDVYVAASMFLYYQEGKPCANKSPDVMVIFGVNGLYERRSFKVWEEQAVPSVIFEITSKSTWMEDLVTKSSLYASLGVHEYFIFDPLEECLEEPLVGLRLDGREYVPIEVDDTGWISQQLDAWVHRDNEFVRLVDRQSKEPVPGLMEIYHFDEQEMQHLTQAQQRAAREFQRANAAEAEIARLRAQLAAIQKNDQT
jgi:Uma2 family endonuclease